MATLSRMSGLGQDRVRQYAAICAVLGMTAMITFPAMIYLTFGLNYPVSALLSPHWREVLPLIAILAPGHLARFQRAFLGFVERQIGAIRRRASQCVHRR